jgi:hypothetical protein
MVSILKFLIENKEIAPLTMQQRRSLTLQRQKFTDKTKKPTKVSSTPVISKGKEEIPSTAKATIKPIQREGLLSMGKRLHS